ncbi:MAG TPA: cytochrome c, partial [Vicinamibacteria bacterium]|nr:cytochrome c [Vicinamibacteria bacterium]
VPSGGIGGDMSFYYNEPKAGNVFVFALDGGGPARVPPGTNLTTIEGSLPRVGEPGHTLGGRVLPGYGFEPTEGGEPLPGASPPLPTEGGTPTQASPFSGDEEAIARGERTYRARCVGCHETGAARGAPLFRTTLSPSRFLEAVAEGREGTLMPSFGSLLTSEQILELHAFVVSRDRLE